MATLNDLMDQVLKEELKPTNKDLLGSAIANVGNLSKKQTVDERIASMPSIPTSAVDSRWQPWRVQQNAKAVASKPQENEIPLTDEDRSIVDALIGIVKAAPRPSKAEMVLRTGVESFRQASHSYKTSPLGMQIADPKGVDKMLTSRRFQDFLAENESDIDNLYKNLDKRGTNLRPVRTFISELNTAFQPLPHILEARKDTIKEGIEWRDKIDSAVQRAWFESLRALANEDGLDSDDPVILEDRYGRRLGKDATKWTIKPTEVLAGMGVNDKAQEMTERFQALQAKQRASIDRGSDRAIISRRLGDAMSKDVLSHPVFSSLYKTAQNANNTVTSAIGGAIDKVVPGLGTALSYGSMSALEASEAMNRMMDMGVDTDIALDFASQHGYVSGAIEYVEQLKNVRLLVGKGVAEKLSANVKGKTLQALGKVFGNKLTDILGEGTEEVMQEVSNLLFASAALQKQIARNRLAGIPFEIPKGQPFNKDGSVNWKAALPEMGESFISGIQVALTMGTIGTVRSTVYDRTSRGGFDATTQEGVQEVHNWAVMNPVEAEKLAQKETPSRKDMKEAGVPEMPQKARRKFSETLREIIGDDGVEGLKAERAKVLREFAEVRQGQRVPPRPVPVMTEAEEEGAIRRGEGNKDLNTKAKDSDLTLREEVDNAIAQGVTVTRDGDGNVSLNGAVLEGPKAIGEYALAKYQQSERQRYQSLSDSMESMGRESELLTTPDPETGATLGNRVDQLVESGAKIEFNDDGTRSLKGSDGTSVDESQVGQEVMDYAAWRVQEEASKPAPFVTEKKTATTEAKAETVPEPKKVNRGVRQPDVETNVPVSIDAKFKKNAPFVDAAFAEGTTAHRVEDGRLIYTNADGIETAVTGLGKNVLADVEKRIASTTAEAKAEPEPKVRTNKGIKREEQQPIPKKEPSKKTMEVAPPVEDAVTESIKTDEQRQSEEHSRVREAVRKISDFMERLGVIRNASDTVDVKLSEVKNSVEGLSQFKSDSDPETGVVAGKELTGRPNDTLVGTVVIMELNDGTKVVVTGRHRIDLYRRNGRKTIPAKIIYEADGWTLNEAQTIDAMLNIMDGQGEVKDYVDFFDKTKPTEAEAGKDGAGLLSRKIGRNAFGISQYASNDVRAATNLGRDGYYKARGGQTQKISTDQAAAIAYGAPVGEAPINEALQRRALGEALRGATPEELTYIMAGYKAIDFSKVKQDGPEQMSLFGEEFNSVFEDAEREAKATNKIREELVAERQMLRSALRNADSLQITDARAKELGIADVTNKEQIKAAERDVTLEVERWVPGLLSPERRAKARELAGLPSVGGESLVLESVTEAQLNKESKEKADREKMQRLAEKTLDGGKAIDTTYTLPGMDDAGNLFNQPAPKVETKAEPEAKTEPAPPAKPKKNKGVVKKKAEAKPQTEPVAKSKPKLQAEAVAETKPKPTPKTKVPEAETVQQQHAEKPVVRTLTFDELTTEQKDKVNKLVIKRLSNKDSDTLTVEMFEQTRNNVIKELYGDDTVIPAVKDQTSSAPIAPSKTTTVLVIEKLIKTPTFNELTASQKTKVNELVTKRLADKNSDTLTVEMFEQIRNDVIESLYGEEAVFAAMNPQTRATQAAQPAPKATDPITVLTAKKQHNVDGKIVYQREGGQWAVLSTKNEDNLAAQRPQDPTLDKSFKTLDEAKKEAIRQVDAEIMDSKNDIYYGSPETLAAETPTTPRKIAAPKKADPKAQGVNVNDIENALVGMFPEVKFAERTTHTMPKRRGHYERAGMIIRGKRRNDYRTRFHEVGHHLDITGNLVRNMPASMRAEILPLGHALYGKRKPVGGYAAEGFAEFFRAYVLQENDTLATTPKTLEWFETEYLPAHPKLADRLMQLRDMAYMIQFQTAEQAMDGFTKAKDNPANTLSPRDVVARAIRYAKKKVTDDNLAVFYALKDTGFYNLPGQKLKNDPYSLMTALEGTAGLKTGNAINGTGTQDIFGRHTGESLASALSGVYTSDQNIKDFNQYIVALRALNYHRNNLDPGITKKNAEAIVAKFKDRKGFDDAVNRVTDWAHRILHTQVEAGIMTAEEYNRIVDKNDVYVTFARRFTDNEMKQWKPDRLVKSDRLKKRTGGESPIHDVMDAMMIMANKMYDRAHEAMVKRALIDSYERSIKNGLSMANFMKEVPPPIDITTQTAEVKFDPTSIKAIEVLFDKLGIKLDAEWNDSTTAWDAVARTFSKANKYGGRENIVPIRLDGQTRWFQIFDHGMWDAINGLSQRPVDNAITKVSKAVTSVQKAGATGWNVSFSLVRNTIRDAVTAGVFSDYSTQYPVLTTLMGIGTYLNDANEASRLYRAMGLGGETYVGEIFGNNRHARAQLRYRDSAMGRAWQKGLKSNFSAILNLPEVGPRIMEFAAAFQHAMKDGDYEEAVVRAMLASKDLTVNFKRAGSVGRQINKFTLFFNAAIQSIDKTARMMGISEAMPWQRGYSDKNHRAKLAARTASRGLLYIAIPSLISYYSNRDKDWWKNMRDFEKWLHTFVDLGEGQPKMRLPSAFELGMVFSVLPALIETTTGRDKKALGEFLNANYNALAPMDFEPTGIQDAGFSLLRNISMLAPIIEVIANQDWTGASIVPETIKAHKQEQDWFTAETDPLYVEFAQYIFNTTGKQISPALTEHLVNGYVGGIAKRSLRTLRTMLDDTSVWGDTQNAWMWPVVGTLFTNPDRSRLVSDFFDTLENLNRAKGSGTISLVDRGKLVNMTDKANELRDMFKRGREVKADKSKSSLDRQREYRDISQQINASVASFGDVVDHGARSKGLEATVRELYSSNESTRDNALKVLVRESNYDEAFRVFNRVTMLKSGRKNEEFRQGVMLLRSAKWGK